MTEIILCPSQLAWLSSDDPAQHLARLRASGELAKWMPQVDRLYGVPQNPKHHPEVDTGLHTEMVLRIAAKLSPDPMVRFAAMLHDVGKGTTPQHVLPAHIDHEIRGVSIVQEICMDHSVPWLWCFLAEMVCQYHLKAHRALHLTPRRLIGLYTETGLIAYRELITPFLLCVKADALGRGGKEDSSYPQLEYLDAVFEIIHQHPHLPETECRVGGNQWQAIHRARLAALSAFRNSFQGKLHG